MTKEQFCKKWIENALISKHCMRDLDSVISDYLSGKEAEIWDKTIQVLQKTDEKIESMFTEEQVREVIDLSREIDHGTNWNPDKYMNTEDEIIKAIKK